MANRFNIDNEENSPFASTPFGIGVNTFLGLPKAGLDVGVDIFRGITRGIGSAGVSFAKLFGGEEQVGSEDIKNPTIKNIFSSIFGNEPIKSIEDRVAQNEVAIKNSPLAKKIGLDKFALPLAFGGTVLSTALDLTLLGGEKNVLKTLAKETDIGKISKILKTINVPDELVPKFAKEFSILKTENEVKEGLNLLKSSMGVKEISEKMIGAGGEEINPLKKLINAIGGAKIGRRELEKDFTKERALRASGVKEVFTKEEGQSGYFKALSKLKGELAPDKKTFSSIGLEQKDMDSLFNQIQRHETIDVFEKVSASNGLQKIFSGEIPPNSQLSLLEDIFGKDLIKEVLKKRPLFEKFKDGFTEVLNVPRALITSFDMSAPFRQGVLFTTTKPKASASAFKEMFSQVFSPKNFDNWLKELPKNPNYQLFKDSGLYIANPNKISGGLSAKEEKFMTNLAEKIPLFGSIVKASERAYVSFLNKLRVDSFNQISSKFQKDGLTFKENPEVFKALAGFVNNATGRGDLGSFNRVAKELNTVFFSPRLIASRFNLLNPIWYAKQPAPVRKEAIKSFAEFIGIGATILTLAKAGGAEVEIDPRSSDFGKIKVGDTRWDMWGGFQQWVRVFSQLIKGERKTSSGDIIELSKKKFPFESRKDVAERFFVGKLAPIPSLGYELLQGQKLFGEKIELKKEVAENTVPLYLQDLKEAIKNFGSDAIFTVGLPAFFGIGTQTYKKQGSGNRFNR